MVRTMRVILHISFGYFHLLGKAVFSQSKRTSVQTKCLHPKQPLGRFSKRTRIHGGRK